MLTQTQLSALHRAHRDERVLSAYVDGSVPNPAEQRSWRLHVERAIKDLRTWLDESARDERDDFEHTVRLLEDQLAGFDPSVGAPGWVAFITKSGVADAHHLPVPVPTRIVWSSGACIAPYLRALAENDPVVVAVVDASQADVYRYQQGAVEKIETIRAYHVMEPPLHMGDAMDPGFHGGTRGTTGTDAAQQGQLTGRDRMLAEAAERVTALAGSTGWILVGGIPGVASHLEERVAKSAPGRVAALEHLDVHATAATIAAAARSGSATLRETHDAELVSVIVDRSAAGGHGVVGAEGTRKALLAGSVHELFVTRRYLEDRAPEAENAVATAFDQDAIVVEVSGKAAELLDAHGGIGAELRFRPADVPATPLPRNESTAGRSAKRQRKPRTKSSM